MTKQDAIESVIEARHRLFRLGIRSEQMASRGDRDKANSICEEAEAIEGKLSAVIDFLIGLKS